MRNIKLIKESLDRQIKSTADQISIIELVDLIVEYAYASRASDIHIEPGEKTVSVRLRIDGILHDSFEFDKDLQSEVITRIKVLSGLKTDVHQVPQDGRFKAKIEEVGEVDVRVSIMPTYYGENAVLRILAETTQSFNLEDLGFSKSQLKIIMKSIKKPYGMILANGPTGSGKTTTLYSIINKEIKHSRSINYYN